ncbi:MAG: hypothetical protein QXO75_02265 [Nitrososphaerota archaeon]
MAEMVFERVKDHLLQNLITCTPYEFVYAFNVSHTLKLDIREITIKLKNEEGYLEYMLNEVEKGFNSLREDLGIKKTDCSEPLSRGCCILCGGKGEELIHSSDHTFYFLLCRECLNRCQENGLIDNIHILRSEQYEHIIKLHELLRYKNVLILLSKLEDEEIDFLKNVYLEDSSGHGQLPFDYIGTDGKGNKYLIDVTSTITGSIAPLSKREKEISKKAKAFGFKILQPVVYFLENWYVEVKLKEVEWV